jgi:hypothetical protein
MTAEELHRSAKSDGAPTAGLAAPLRALWWAANGDWTRAHAVAQEIDTADSAWVHAWLHRQEGDLANADYWYRRAGQARPAIPLEEEWHAIAQRLLG